MDPDDIYSPDAEDIRPHAIAFAQLMFAHSKFEREIRSLQAAITNDLSFGERRSHQWKARERPERMAKLMKRYLGDDLQEAEPVAKLLSDAIGTTTTATAIIMFLFLSGPSNMACSLPV